LGTFPAANERSALDNHREGILRRVSVSILKLVSNFKEAKKKLKLYRDVESF
jgi:hypothetical protein